MAKIIIPKSELPSLSAEQTNRFRFRIINKNRNLSSEWSPIGEVKRQVDDIDYSLPDTFTIDPLQSGLLVSWEKTSGNYQQYDIYRKQYSSEYVVMSGSTFYSSGELLFLESTSESSVVAHGLYSNRVGTSPPIPRGAQIMVRNFTYPRVEYPTWNISDCERKSNTVKLYIDAETDDFDDAFATNGYVYFDITVDYPFTSKATMEIFNGVIEITNIDKTSPGYTILEYINSGADIASFKPGLGSAKRISPDPLFVSGFVDYL